MNCRVCKKEMTTQEAAAYGSRCEDCVTRRSWFWSNVDKNGPEHPTLGRCWLWTGYKIYSGYGFLNVGRKGYTAHRYGWILCFGQPPAGIDVCHTCDNRACVNPTHLFLGTHQANMKDRNQKGRQAKGGHIKLAKLTEDQVREIRKRYRPGVKGSSSRALAPEFNVHHTQILKAVNGRHWKHVE